MDVNEFVAISVHIRKIGNDEHLKKAFTFFDQNKSGYIEIEELRDAFANDFDNTSEEVVEAIILDVDTNKVSRHIWEKLVFSSTKYFLNRLKFLNVLEPETSTGWKNKLWRVCNYDENGNGLEKSFKAVLEGPI